MRISFSMEAILTLRIMGVLVIHGISYTEFDDDIYNQFGSIVGFISDHHIIWF